MVRKNNILFLCLFVFTMFISSCTTLTPVQKQDNEVLNQHLWIEKTLGIGKNFYFLDNNFYDSLQFLEYATLNSAYVQIYKNYKYVDLDNLIQLAGYQETADSLIVTYHLPHIIFQITMPLEDFVYMSAIECNLGNIMLYHRWTPVSEKEYCNNEPTCMNADAVTGHYGTHYYPVTDWKAVNRDLIYCKEQHDPHKNNWYLNFKHRWNTNQYVRNFALNMIADGYVGTVTIVQAPKDAIDEIQANALKLDKVEVPLDIHHLTGYVYKLILNPDNKLLFAILAYEMHNSN